MMKLDFDKRALTLIFKAVGIMLTILFISFGCDLGRNGELNQTDSEFALDEDVEYASSDDFSIEPGELSSQGSKAATYGCLVSKNRNLSNPSRYFAGNVASLSANWSDGTVINNSISSIHVYPGWEVILYQGDNFTGQYLVLKANPTSAAYYDLGNIRFNDALNWSNQPSSIVCRKVLSYKPVLAICWDGFANEKTINKAFETAMSQVSGWNTWKRFWLPGSYDISDTKKRVNELVAKLGFPKSQITCLLIGKSLGGAKTYKMVADNDGFFDDFYKTSIVLVDPHEPGAPGNKGRCDYWYDFVRFRCDSAGWNDHYDLEWRSAWQDNRRKLQYKFYNIYQRDDTFKGYKMTTADICWSGVGDHFDIANHTKTINLIKSAVGFLLQ